MPGGFEQLVFELITKDRASGGLTRVGLAAGDAAGNVDTLSRRLTEVGNKSATARVALEGDKTAQAALDKLDARLVSLDRRTASPNITVEGAARAAAEIAAVDVELDRLRVKSEEAAGAGGLGALVGGSGGGVGAIGALIAAGVALSPVIATVGIGLGGVAAAAFGVAAPIEKAAKASGGLQANMARLNPEQQQVAQGLLGLGQQFGAFEKQMQPAVFGIFNQGLSLAGHLLHDVEPVAGAAGKALGGVLGQVDAEFQSGTWQQFFGFMARTAGPDVRLLGQDFTGLLHVLPPLIEGLQPVATGLLKIVGAGERTVGIVEAISAKAQAARGGQENIFQKIGDGVRWLENHTPQGHKSLGQLAEDALGITSAAHAAGNAVLTAGPKFFSLDKAVAALNTDMTKLVGNLLTLQGGELSWKQSLQAAQAQLKSNTAGLEGNSAKALANRQAVLSSTNAAVAFAQQELTTGKNIAGASDTVQRQIRWLQGLHDKSRFVRDELHALRAEERLLAAQQINQTIRVQGLGQWSVSQSLAPGPGHRRAAGGLLTGPGGPTSDSIPLWGSTGEYMVKAAAVSKYGVRLFDQLNAMKLASGGLIPSERGLPGMVPWVKADDRATIRLIDEAVVRATVAGMRAAQSAAAASAGAARGSGGPSSGAVSALQRYAASLFGQFGWGMNQLGPLIALWNGESGWNPNARNPSSGAFGIPQALPPGKMGALAASGNAAAQIRWGEGYIHSVYGTPGNAYGTWLSRSPHWYGGGGSGIFTHPTVIGVGERGPERVDITPIGRSAGRGGPLVHVENFNSYDATDPELLAQRLSFLITATSLGT